MMKKLKEILYWVAIDGLLHFLVCYAVMLSLIPIIGIGLSVVTTISIAVLKEVYDSLRGTNTLPQMYHDFICDAVGILLALLMQLI